MLYFILPGKVAKGVKLADGSQLEYPLNGLLSQVVTLFVIIDLHLVYGPEYGFEWIADHYLQLSVATIVFSFLQALFLYPYSFLGKKLLAAGGNSGNVIYDFFIGRELNPRIRYLDLKYFNELRPGLLHWGLYNFAFAYKQS